jgi:hypothetical protein
MPRTARGRMLWGSISTSERVNRLSLKAALLYTWLLPHADDQGRMSANPATIKAVVIPMRDDISLDEIEYLLLEIEKARLIRVYTPSKAIGWSPNDRDLMLQINEWWDYQALREPKASRYPPPRGWDKDRVGSQTRNKFGRYSRDE